MNYLTLQNKQQKYLHSPKEGLSRIKMKHEEQMKEQQEAA